MNTRPGRAILCLAIAHLGSGCSVYEIYDAYTVDGAETLRFESDSVELEVAVNPDPRFGSIGLFGLPVVPVYVDASDTTELRLAIILRLLYERDFSLEPNLCLSVASKYPVCPHQLEISALGFYQDDGSMYPDGRPRWRRMADFSGFGIEPMRLTPSPSINQGRIESDHIYEHYDYSGRTPWDRLHINATYTYLCESTCPEAFELDAAGLPIVSEFTVLEGRFTFLRSRERSYIPAIQD